MKFNVKLLLRGALLLALCIASQFMKNVSTYITGSLVNTILVIATLSCGFKIASAIGVIAPLTSWLITGSAVIGAFPGIVAFIMLGNIILVGSVWLFVKWLHKKIPQGEKLSFKDGRFRQVSLIVLVACVLWSALTIAFTSSLASALNVSATPLLVVSLIMISGVFLVFFVVWALVSHFPQTWTLICGMVIGSVIKAVFMWLTIVKLILPEKGFEAAQAAFSVTQLVTALIGSMLAFLIWIPIKRFVTEEKQ